MLSTLAALLAVSPTSASADSPLLSRTAWVVATVGHSEWCPAGNVRLDLRSGRYAYTAKAPRRVCGDRGLERPVRSGRLGGERLASLRAAYLRLLTSGVESQSCRDGRGPEQIIVSNGGDRVLLVATGAKMVSAPENQSCWSKAATALHDLLDDTFSSSQQP